MASAADTINTNTVKKSQGELEAGAGAGATNANGTVYTPDTFKPLLSTLLASPNTFSASDMQDALAHLLASPPAVHPAQIGAFLTALHVARAEHRPELLGAAAQSLRERAVGADVEGKSRGAGVSAVDGGDVVVDIVGTGGDGHNTFNVSTTAAIVAAGAGVRVCKHGSRASTSSSGSADLLQSLGCTFTSPSPSTTSIPIKRIPFTFLLAPHFHPTLALLAPHRKALPFRTLFNCLGPLLNPARPHAMVLGVADPALGPVFAEALKASGDVRRALVVCGAERLDEVSCAGPTHAWRLAEDGGVTALTLDPETDFGVQRHALSEVRGASPAENAETFKALLDVDNYKAGGEVVAEKLVPVLDYVLINAAALLVVAGKAKDYKEGVALARESIVSGKAWKAFEAFKDECQRIAAEAKTTSA